MEPATVPSQHHWRVRKLVTRVAVGREIFCELTGNGFDALDDAGLETTAGEIGFHVAADPLPTLATHLCIDAAVGNDLHLAVGE